MIIKKKLKVFWKENSGYLMVQDLLWSAIPKEREEGMSYKEYVLGEPIVKLINKELNTKDKKYDYIFTLRGDTMIIDNIKEVV